MPDEAGRSAPSLGGGVEGSERLLAALVAEGEEERSRAGRRLHDSVGPLLTAIGFRLDALRHAYDASVSPIAESITEIQDLLDGAMRHVRDLSFTLNPSVVERAGIGFAMERLAEDLGRRWSAVVRVSFAEGARATGSAAKTVFGLALRAVEYVLVSGTKHVEVQLSSLGRAYVIEVLYDESSPEGLGKLDAERRSRWALFTHQTALAGSPIEFLSEPGGKAVIRVKWAPEEGA